MIPKVDELKVGTSRIWQLLDMVGAFSGIQKLSFPGNDSMAAIFFFFFLFIFIFFFFGGGGGGGGGGGVGSSINNFDSNKYENI